MSSRKPPGVQRRCGEDEGAVDWSRGIPVQLESWKQVSVSSDYNVCSIYQCRLIDDSNLGYAANQLVELYFIIYLL
jgi:hypothetical protein